jgi:CHAT domain-containing protein
MVAREVREVAAIHAGAVLTEATTRKEFLHLLAEHELVHLAGHAVFLDGLPFASGLRMSDGYVTVHDLAATRLRARLVSFGVCSGLRLGRDASAGDRWAGFVLALMSGGVRTVVGPVAAVRDDVAYRFDVVLHEEIRDTGDVGRAFRTAVRAVRELDQRPATWGSFQLYGDSRPWEKT